ncbi:unnamed protein product, partial [marine sediment metagenome]
RRKLLEEAAGISGLHNRRHEAELRLRGAETNLSRLDDVIVEIEGQLEALKRQARQAVRYRNLSGDIRRAEATALHLRWTESKAMLGEADGVHSESGSVTATREQEQAEAAKLQAEAAALLPELRDQAASAAAAVQRITLAQESLNAERDRVQNRLEALSRQLQELGHDIERERNMVSENQIILERLAEEERDMEGANTGTGEQRAAADQHRQSAETALKTSEEQLAALTHRVAEITASSAQIERTIKDAETRSARLDNEIASLSGRIEALGPVGD